MATESAEQRRLFTDLYETLPPWDIGRPQPVLTSTEAKGLIQGSVLDLGCGTGENALFFAEKGHRVAGYDFLPVAIERARAKAESRQLDIDFRVADALDLPETREPFDNITDSGLFHVFSDEQRPRYKAQLERVLKPGGSLWLLCFSDAEPAGQGPRRVSEAELRSVFAEGWQIHCLEPARFEVREDAADTQFSPGGPKAWFAHIQRNELP